ncbi:hypothetical protein AV530_004378 [Patagioenas fasciata monilis]|uniref:Peptidase S1 domain-containing protein n=1 Tax=Patagioenas fasciata monilis TaxID=372326 RepID=A0A1V4JD16_PATFA|nr:hypothetical protein AV530_004378 [Patagioenas fasciata monilis]
MQRMVQKLVPHPSYDPTTKDNDIMMIKLLTPVTLSSRIQAIPVASCLPDPGTTCTTSGWGAVTSPEVSYPDVLQCVNVTIFSTAQCRQFYPSSITDNMLCAGSIQGGMAQDGHRAFSFTSILILAAAGLLLGAPARALLQGNGTNGAPDEEARIIGGRPCRIDQRPFQVAMIKRGQILCGGSLISNQWVLSAAHCKQPLR